MTKLRKAAQGQECQVRLEGVCNHNPETTVLAHVRRANVAGIGQKPNDYIVVWACSDCHDQIDGRSKPHFPAYELDRYVLEGMCRTLDELKKQGVIQ